MDFFKEIGHSLTEYTEVMKKAKSAQASESTLANDFNKIKPYSMYEKWNTCEYFAINKELIEPTFKIQSTMEKVISQHQVSIDLEGINYRRIVKRWCTVELRMSDLAPFGKTLKLSLKLSIKFLFIERTNSAKMQRIRKVTQTGRRFGEFHQKACLLDDF